MFKAYATKHNFHWGFLWDEDDYLYINHMEFDDDMADDRRMLLTQEIKVQ